MPALCAVDSKNTTQGQHVDVSHGYTESCRRPVSLPGLQGYFTINRLKPTRAGIFGVLDVSGMRSPLRNTTASFVHSGAVVRRIVVVLVGASN